MLLLFVDCRTVFVCSYMQIGNVWQYTDEFVDVHTRAAVLRGTSNYRPGGSGWYFRNALVRLWFTMLLCVGGILALTLSIVTFQL